MTTQYNDTQWKGKTWVTLGDSITAQDGRVYSGTTTVARGYQTVINELLEFTSINNQGVSGKPVANGTAQQEKA